MPEPSPSLVDHVIAGSSKLLLLPPPLRFRQQLTEVRSNRTHKPLNWTA